MKTLTFAIVAGLALSMSACTPMVDPNGVDTPSVTTQFLTGTGGYILTAGAVEALTYKAIKSQPNSKQTFADIVEILADVSEDKVLTPEEVKDIIKANLKGMSSKYRTYAMLSLDIAFVSWESTGRAKDIDLVEYNNIVNGIILGISEGIDLYDEEQDM